MIVSLMIALFWILLNKRLMRGHSHVVVTVYGLGLGTLMLAPNQHPVSGVARIDGDPDAPTLHYSAARLDHADADLGPAILGQDPAAGPGRP